MAKGNDRSSKAASATTNPSTSSTPTADTVERSVVVLAEQLGRIVGTVQAKAEGWLDRGTLRDQIAGIRDGAAELLDHLAGHVTSAESESATGKKPPVAKAADAGRNKGRSGGFVDAPGKKHRKPMPSTPGAKHSDTRIAKVKVVNESRRRGGR
ncbi:MAG TPA: hypothetical protein VGX46_04510 [Vicinamibacterales bacterium]|nr:hypothetical protein [Vicinamibacterales bacterium]